MPSSRRRASFHWSNTVAALLLTALAVVYFVATLLAQSGSGAFSLFAQLPGTKPAGTYEEHLWLSSSDVAGAQSAQAHAASITVASPIWFEASSSGVITRYTGAYDQRAFQTAMTAGGAAFLPTLENAGSLAFLDTAAGRDAQSTKVVDLVLVEGYDGVDIDFEALPVAQRAAFSAYVPLLAQKLHAQGKWLIVTVHPKWNDAASYTGAGAQDWAVIGQHADRVRIMLYDWDGTVPGPVSPFYWIDGVLTYAESAIPSAKLIVGLPWYGFDFAGTARSKLTWATVQQHLATYAPTVSRHLGMQYESGEMTYSYVQGGVTHTVFFPDADAYRRKTELVRTLHPAVAGFSNYRPGYEDPAVWDIVATLKGEAGPVAPSVTLTSPASGQTWKVGETRIVTWTATGADTVTVRVAGPVTETLATLPGTATSFAWAITQGADAYTITVDATNAVGTTSASAALTVMWQCVDSDNGSTTIAGTTTANGGGLTSAVDVCALSAECKAAFGAKTTSCLREYACTGSYGAVSSALTKCTCTNGACSAGGKPPRR